LQLANAIAPLLKDVSGLENSLRNYQTFYERRWLEMMGDKLGIENMQAKDDQPRVDALISLMSEHELDMTLFFRRLCNHQVGFKISEYQDSFYDFDKLSADFMARFNTWFKSYDERIQNQDNKKRVKAMKQANPKYVFRNYLAQQAIDKAQEGDYAMIGELMDVLRKPYDEQTEYQHFSEKRPDWARTKAGCSMLSCSS